MGFRIFMLIMALMIPVTMIGFGRYFMNKAPKKINAVFGYRTGMSMKNADTWAFAHRYFGRIWFIEGLVLLPLSAAAVLLAFGRPDETVGFVGSVIEIIQLVPLITAIFVTERALRRTFDREGNRRQTENI